jgi:hypothetical protein
MQSGENASDTHSSVGKTSGLGYFLFFEASRRISTVSKVGPRTKKRKYISLVVQRAQTTRKIASIRDFLEIKAVDW